MYNKSNIYSYVSSMQFKIIHKNENVFNTKNYSYVFPRKKRSKTNDLNTNLKRDSLD